jgi:cell shape-determining protein MreC
LSRFEEATQHRSELEHTKRENELLRKRVRELEQILKKQKEVEPSVSLPSQAGIIDT